ncbi:MAG: hypothetical protein OIN66_15670 [Candidatus Methanoperedens sp.]|nr:hypothetical protein [Candidatus Methanoperedens sp.]
MNKKIILFLAFMAVSFYAMPRTVALFAGQHTYYSGMGIECEKCHSDILAEIETSGYVYEKHRDAAGNTNYTTYLSLGGIDYSAGVITAYDGTNWTWNSTQKAWKDGSQLRNFSLDRNNNGIIDGAEICMLCHNASLAGATDHTGIVIRGCDDDRCHGNRNHIYNNPLLFGKTAPDTTAAGHNLSQANIHQPYYLETSNQSSRYAAIMAFNQTPGNIYGESISKGHWACEGCHTGTAVSVTIIPPPPYNHTDSSPVKRRYN